MIRFYGCYKPRAAVLCQAKRLFTEQDIVLVYYDQVYYDQVDIGYWPGYVFWKWLMALFNCI